MILTAHQPVYLPWLGLFHKIALSDQFCYFDIAQYQKKDYNNRNKIKTQSGELWLSVPVESKNHYEKKVGEILIVQNGWQRKHIKTIKLSYQKALYYSDYMSEIQNLILDNSNGNLSDLNLAMLRYFMKCLGLDKTILKASDYQFKGEKSDLVLDMCQKLGASIYVFGEQGRNYANIDKFKTRGIKPFFQDYHHPTYKQLHGKFIAFMSIIDLLFNNGPDSLKILLSGNQNKDQLNTTQKSKLEES